MAAEFQYTIKRTSSRIIEIVYSGYMPEDATHVLRTEQAVNGAERPVGLYYFVPGFVGYHRSQIQKHGALFTRLAEKVMGIAVVGARPVVRFGAITVSLISKTPLKTFDERDEALTWLDGLFDGR